MFSTSNWIEMNRSLKLQKKNKFDIVSMNIQRLVVLEVREVEVREVVDVGGGVF